MSHRPFEEVVREFGPMVLRVCRAVLGPDEAEDAWSETFLAALRAYPRLRPGSDLEAWLVTIAHRKALDHIRSTRRRAVTVPELPEPIDGSSAPPPRTPDDDLWAALRALPLKQRETVVYHHVVGLPYRDVARIVGGSEAAARRAAADGIATLRRTYAEDLTP